MVYLNTLPYACDQKGWPTGKQAFCFKAANYSCWSLSLSRVGYTMAPYDGGAVLYIFIWLSCTPQIYFIHNKLNPGVFSASSHSSPHRVILQYSASTMSFCTVLYQHMYKVQPVMRSAIALNDNPSFRRFRSNLSRLGVFLCEVLLLA